MNAQSKATILSEDGYINILTGVGGVQDPATSTTYRPDPRLTQGMLDIIFEGDGVGRRIVEGPAEEMTREWFHIEGDEGEAVIDVLEELGAAHCFTEASTWARLYGGAMVLFVVDDGKDFDQELIPENVREVIGMRVYDRWAITFESMSVSRDPIKRLHGFPEFYTVQPPTAPGFRCHESRLCHIPGKRLPERLRVQNQNWDASILQGCYTALQRYGVGLGYASAMMRDFVQSVLAVKDLSSLIAAGKDDVVRKRLRLLDLSRSILNTMVIDADGETYDKSMSSVAGVPDIMDRFAEHLCAVTGIPKTKLFGASAAGLNATGEGDDRNYRDFLAAEQKRTLGPLAEKLVQLVYASAEGPTSGKEPEEWSVVWNKIAQPSEKEVAELRKIVADTDKIYVDAGVLSPMEVAESRFGQGGWQMDTALIEGTERDEDAAAPEPVVGAPGAVDPITGEPMPPKLMPGAPQKPGKPPVKPPPNAEV